MYCSSNIANHGDLDWNQGGHAEHHTEQCDHGNVAAGTHGLLKILGARFGESNTKILDHDGRMASLRDDFALRLDLCRIGNGLSVDAVGHVGGIRNELTEEDLCWS